MIASLNSYKEYQMLGVVVLYRPSNKLLAKTILGAMVTSYDATTGRANLLLVGHQYHLPNVEYEEELTTDNRWCYKEDVRLTSQPATEIEEHLPEEDRGPSEEPSPQGAASEGDTSIQEPSEEPPAKQTPA